MPELPEVQTIVDQLKEKLVGKKITAVDIRLPKMFQGDRKDLIGAKITDVLRRAKIIILKLDNGQNIVIHLKMTGQLIYADKDVISFPNPIPFAGTTLPGKTTHVIIKLDKGTVFFNDMRQFGWMKVLSDFELAEIHEKHGPEPFGPGFTIEYLTRVLSNWGRPVKILLMEQSKISGIGNIYANEALWYAGISPMKRGREITRINELYEAIKKVLKMGLEYGGSSASDEAFVNAEGRPGKMQEHFVVYQKDGQECPRCHHTIRRSQLGGRGTFFCPKCQT